MVFGSGSHQSENRGGVWRPQPSQQVQNNPPPPAAALCRMRGASAPCCFVTSCQHLLELNILPAMWSRSSTPPGTAAVLLKALLTVSLLKPAEIYTATLPASLCPLGHHQTFGHYPPEPSQDPTLLLLPLCSSTHVLL